MPTSPTAHAAAVDALLAAFDAELSPGPAPLCRRYHGGRHGRRVVFGAVVHGNEIGSVPGVLEVMRELAGGTLRYGGTVDFFIGNAEAARRNTRMVEADLNRVFTAEAAPSAERRRAIALTPVLTGCDLFVDLHQTGRPTLKPFYTLPWLATEALWVRALGQGEAWITRPAGTAFDPGTCCTDEFVRDQGLPGLTLELGHAGFDAAAARLAAATIRRALAVDDAVAEEGDGALAAAAAAMPPMPLYQLTHAEPCTDRSQRLRDDIHNWEPVRAGDDISAPGAPPVVVPQDGVVMFPKFPPTDEPLPASLYRLAEPLDPEDLPPWAGG